MPRKYYSKTPSQKVIYFYSAVCHQVSPKPIIRPALTPQYYPIKKQLEALAEKGVYRHLGITEGSRFVMERIEETIFTDLEDERVFYRQRQLERDFDALDRQDIPDTKEGLEKFFIQEENEMKRKIEMALELTPVPLPYLTEEEFFKLMVETHYKGLAERWSKSWKKLIQNKQEIGLKEWEIV